MSDKKNIKVKFNEQEVVVPLFETFKELTLFLKDQFTIPDDKMNNLSIFYYDSEGDQISFQGESDYKIFYEDESPNKVIECEIVNKEAEDISIEPPEPLKSGAIFKRPSEQSQSLEISALGNSLFSVESLNNGFILQKKNNNNKENEDFIKGINQMNNLVNKTIQDNSKDEEILRMKKQIEEMIKQHKEELKKRRRKMKKKYKNLWPK